MATMKELAAMLGVEIGEEFEVKTWLDNESIGTYKVTENDIKYRSTNGEWYTILNGVVENICTGRCRIIKKPWKPEMGKHYWFVGIDGGPVETCWIGNMLDYALYATGNCFRAENDTFDHREEVLACMKAIYENGREEQKSEKPSAEEAAKVLKEYCAGRDCNHCKFCIDKENVEGCRLRDTPEIWPI